MSIRRHLHRRHIIGAHIVVLSLFTLAPGTPASDMIATGSNLTDGGNNTLVSPGGSFTLGFFSQPGGVPTKRYLGTWFSFSPPTDPISIYWVANRDTPLNDTSGVLLLATSGELLLLDGSNKTIWFSGSTSSTPPMGARLLESGNLVVVQQNNSTSWQSFDHPCNALLPGMKIGHNFWNGDDWHLSSWLSASDPGTGSYRYITELGGGTPENVLWDRRNCTKKFRTGPWNGERFDGVPEMASYATDFIYHMTISRSEATYSYTAAKPSAAYSQLRLGEGGLIQRLVWDKDNRQWNPYLTQPRGDCDNYAYCGPFSLCNRNTASTSLCSCFNGFVPAFPKEWISRQYSDGCRPNVSLDCSSSNGSSSSTDGFQVVPSVKLPDTQNATVDMDTDLDECRRRCLVNCSCLAYAAADVKGGGGGSGCIIWTDSFTDLCWTEKGQDFYLRLPKSLLGKKKVPIKIVLPVVVGALVLTGIIIFGIIRWRSADKWEDAAPSRHFIPYRILKDATENFSKKYKIGQGSFGTVYQCELPRRETTRIEVPGGVNNVAVKVLNQSVLNNFERELQVLFGLCHVNLVRLLAYSYSKHGENGPLLIYEYMEKGSLDLYVFGQDDQRKQLSWTQRLEIITSIADGVCYLHVGSGRHIIHRDLKPANILLADDLTPKIADFGLAKHAPDPTVLHTPVGPYGYMAPECRNGQTTKKSDVYSFGVVLLEIISGSPNSVTLMQRLLPQAWNSLNTNNEAGCTLEKLILDKNVRLSNIEKADPKFLSRLWRCIQIGLLCVQESPDRRPDIKQVLEMLKTEVELPEPDELTLRKERDTSNTRPAEEHTLREEAKTSNTRRIEDDIEESQHL